MAFADYIGNERVVTALRGMLALGRVPSAMLFSGPRGVGKYTLAVRFAQAANCERLQDDSCGECNACQRIGRLLEPQPLIEAGLRQRGESADAATVERVPLILEVHPDVWAMVPDPVRLRNPVARPLIRIGQVRAVQRAAYFRPEGKRRVFILDGAQTMRPDAANAALKVLEEPPETATLILLAPSAEALLPTTRSRCLQFHFAPLVTEQVEEFLKKHRKLAAKERRLAAELSGGSPGAALELDVEESKRLRREALRLLDLAVEGQAYGEVFGLTEQLAKREKESFEAMLELFYGLLSDMLELGEGVGGRLRNPDLERELSQLAERVGARWVRETMQRFDELASRWRRNINRQLGLDAVVAGMREQD